MRPKLCSGCAKEMAQYYARSLPKHWRKKKSAKLLYNTKEAASLLNVPASWLATMARRGQIPSRMLGHYRQFSQSDLDAIIERAAVKNGAKNGSSEAEVAETCRDLTYGKTGFTGSRNV